MARIHSSISCWEEAIRTKVSWLLETGRPSLSFPAEIKHFKKISLVYTDTGTCFPSSQSNSILYTLYELLTNDFKFEFSRLSWLGWMSNNFISCQRNGSNGCLGFLNWKNRIKILHKNNSYAVPARLQFIQYLISILSSSLWLGSAGEHVDVITKIYWNSNAWQKYTCIQSWLH